MTQGLLIPLMQKLITDTALSPYFGHWRGRLPLGPMGSFVLNFVIIDYLYYWNHRFLHSEALWPFHRLHHTSKFLDHFATSRNTWFSSFLILYVWLNSILMFLTDSPNSYLLAVAITAALDLWRHTSFQNPTVIRVYRFLSPILITPLEHQWHHSDQITSINFGANFSIWDQWHGTYFSPANSPEKYGVKENYNLIRDFILPSR